MKRHLTALAAVAMLCTVTNALAFDTVLFTEDFSSVTLGDSVNERLGYALDTVEAGTADFAPEPGVFSTAVTGWTVDNAFDNFGNVNLAYDPSTAGDPTADGFPAVAPPVGTVIGNVGVPEQGSAVNGVDEYEGWTFLSKDFLSSAASAPAQAAITTTMAMSTARCHWRRDAAARSLSVNAMDVLPTRLLHRRYLPYNVRSSG